MQRIVFVLLSLLLAGPAFAHAMLDRAEPKVGSAVVSAPKEIKLWFTEKLEQSFSRVEVTNAAGERVDAGKARVDAATRNLLHVPLKALLPGNYKVNWHVMSTDTHKTDGSFSFRVGQ